MFKGYVYGDTKSNYTYEYAKKNRINFSTNKTVTAYFYIGIKLYKTNDTTDLANGGPLSYRVSN